MPALGALFDLSGRAAIVAGGLRGLGRELAERLAEAGASLMLCARGNDWLTPTVAELQQRHGRVEAAICDVSKPGRVQAVADTTLATCSRIDILINNSGYITGRSWL